MTERATDRPGIIQLTNVEQDERFYCRRLPDGTTAFAPSWTHVLGETWPRSIGLEQWRGDVGNQRAEEIMVAAGEEGTYVHDAIHSLLKGGWLASDDVRRTFPRARALKPLRCLQAFLDWAAAFKPEPTALESVTWCDDPRVAGTMDFYGWIQRPIRKGNSVAASPDEGDRVTAILDWKTSKSLHDQHRAQVAGYVFSERAGGTVVDVAGILHLGNATQHRWSLADITPDLDHWTATALTAVRTYHLHHPDARPSDEQFPAVFALPGTAIEADATGAA